MASKGERPLDASAGETYRTLAQYMKWIAFYTLHTVCIAVMAFAFVEPDVPVRGRVLGVAVASWSAGRLLTRRLTREWVSADLVVVAIYLIGTPWIVGTTEFTTGPSPMLALAGTTVIAYGIAYPARQSIFALIVVNAAWAIGIARVPDAGPPWGIFSYDFLVVEWILVAICRRLVVRAAIVADDVLAGAGDDEVTRSVAVARHRLARQQFAIMHDTAASTLLMVGQGAAHNPALLAAQADRDLATIAAFSASPATLSADQRDIVTGVHALSAQINTPVEFTGVTEVRVDADVADAIEGAAREALANVDRHARASRVTVTVTAREVRIADDGIGFDIGSPRVAQRFGVRNSIRGRMADVGGHVRIDSHPGGGTTVVIQWGVAAARSDELREGVELIQRLLYGFGYGLTVIATVVVVMQSQRSVFDERTNHAEQALVALAALACALLAGFAVAHSAPRPVIWASCVLVIVLVPIQEYLLPAASLTTGSNWAFAALGWVVVALTYRFSLREGMTALAVLWVIGAGMMLALRADRDVLVTVGYDAASVALIQASVFVFTGFLVSSATTARLVNDEHVRRWAAEAEERALADDVAGRYAMLSKTLVPLLQRLREPTTDPRDPQIRLAALIEDARLRRLFAQTDNRDHQLLQELHPIIGEAEERGVSVTVDTGTVLPYVGSEVRDQLLAIAGIALAGTQSRARVVFMANGAAVTISVVCDCDAQTRARIESASGIIPAVAGDLTWVEQEIPFKRDQE